MKLHLEKFINTEQGRIIMSILLGLGLASLFRRVCRGRNCNIFKAPPIEDIKDKIYKNGDKCIKYTPVSTKCSLGTKTVRFE